MPTVVLEAKARGLQIIATDIGAMSEIHDHLLPPGDNNKLAIAIRDMGVTTMRSNLPVHYKWEVIAQRTFDALI